MGVGTIANYCVLSSKGNYTSILTILFYEYAVSNLKQSILMLSLLVYYSFLVIPPTTRIPSGSETALNYFNGIGNLSESKSHEKGSS